MTATPRALLLALARTCSRAAKRKHSPGQHHLVRNHLVRNNLKSSSRERAFVTSELFIVLAAVAVSVVGAAILARKLHLGWLASSGLIAGAIIIVLLALSLLDASSRRNRP